MEGVSRPQKVEITIRTFPKAIRETERHAPRNARPERRGHVRLILLRHKVRHLFLVLNRRAQHGHRGSVRAIATINLR